jgi:hypothetical protein
MSIPPTTKPSDYDKFLSRYLADLNLQVKLNQENYDANVAFFKTGVQATERADTRSLESRKMDVETLKIQARTMLNKLTNSLSADEVLTFLVNNNLLFFFVQNFVDFERTINKRYPSQTASAPILRVLIQKSFDKQNEEIPLLKDELIVATNTVASREIMKKALTDIYEKSDTNPVLYEILRKQDNLDLFPTLQEKLNINKFPEKKFFDEDVIMSWNNLPSNKTIQELLDLYEQLYSGVSPNIQSTQNQINNIENNIETQLDASYDNLDYVIQLGEAKEGKRNTAKAIEDRTAAYQEKLRIYEEKLAADEERQQLTKLMKARVGKKNVEKELQDQVKRQRLYQEQRGMEEEEYLQKLIAQEQRRAKYPNLGNVETSTIISEPFKGPAKTRMAVVKKPETKGSFKLDEETINPVSYFKKDTDESGRSKVVSSNLKKNIAIQEPIQVEPVQVTSIKVKSMKAKQEPIYTRVDQSLLQKYLNNMPTDWKKIELKAYAKENYGINYTKLKEELGDNANETNLRTFIATQQYLQDNRYASSGYVTTEEIPALNELTRGSYSEKIFIPDPTARKLTMELSPNVVSPNVEGKGLLTKRQQDIHRFKVLKGQILAGNNSKKIIVELKALVLKLNKLGQISNKQATQVLQELNSVLK